MLTLLKVEIDKGCSELVILLSWGQFYPIEGFDHSTYLIPLDWKTPAA